MSFSYDRYYDRRSQRSNPRIFSGPSNRTTFGYWVPLIITVTAATAGVAAWIWSERTSNEDEEFFGEYQDQYPPPPGPFQGPSGSFPGPFPGEIPPPEAGVAGGLQEKPPEYRGQYETNEYGETSSFSQGVVRDDFPLPHDRQVNEEQEGFMAQWRRRTLSPQQLLDGASKRVAAGVAAMGRGLSSITEEDREAGRGEEVFSDHERWSEEAESLERGSEARDAAGAGLGAAGAAVASGALGGRPREGPEDMVAQHGKLPSAGRGRKRTIAVVVSAVQKGDDNDTDDSTYRVQHAVSLSLHLNSWNLPANEKYQSLLSHLIGHAHSSTIHLLILIHAPHLSKHPLADTNTTHPPGLQPSSSMASYEEVPHPFGLQRQVSVLDPEGAIISSYTDPANAPSSSSSSSSTLYNALATQAAALVSHPTHILPFRTPNGHVHLLRSLAPNLVYVQESLCGESGGGENVKAVEGWVGQVVVVLGEDAAGAGLVDTETENETEDEGRETKPRDKSGPRKWWMDESRVGLGKGVEVVEGMNLTEDWVRRVGS